MKYDTEKTPIERDMTLRAVWTKRTTPTPPHEKTAVESVLLAEARLVVNPFGATLRIEEVAPAELLEVYNMQGQPLYAQRLDGENHLGVPSQSWPSGVYVVRMVAPDGARCPKAIKE